MAQVECPYFPACTGCQFIGESIDWQKNKKVENLQKNLLTFHEGLSIGWNSPGEFALRDRLDFILEDGRLGLYSSEKKQIIDLKSCGQLSPALASWYAEFRQFSWPIKKGSVRLRVGPTGLKGVWLDFANEDIKNLLDEKNLLEKLLSMAFVEIGQKRKSLKKINAELKLKDPEPQLWFESRFLDKILPIYSYVGSFTQPSFASNQMLLSIMSKWVQESGVSQASEFGSGIGNLSIMLLSHIKRLQVFENDTLSVEAFKKTLGSYPENFGSANIQFHLGDYQKKQSLEFSKDELLMLNPPRSGLKDFLESLRLSHEKPKTIIYMSCATDSWARDGAVLKNMDYDLKKLEIVDQFPQTSHYEVLSYWLLQGV
jgi:23S rRNA (uracil1939-C5)-methyltransferase